MYSLPLSSPYPLIIWPAYDSNCIICTSNLLLFGSATIKVATDNNDLASKFHIPLLTLSHKESNPEGLNVEAVDSQTL